MRTQSPRAPSCRVFPLCALVSFVVDEVQMLGTTKDTKAHKGMRSLNVRAQIGRRASMGAGNPRFV
jgi:hypothetical protein